MPGNNEKGEEMEPDPKPWVNDYGMRWERESALKGDDRFRPRPEYSQNPEDYR